MTSTLQVAEYDGSQDEESSTRKNRDVWRSVSPLQITEYDRLEDENSGKTKIRNIPSVLCAQLGGMQNGEDERGSCRRWKRSSGVAVLFLLCVLLLLGLILLSVNYIKAIGQCNSGYNNFTEERDQLKACCNNLVEERDQLKVSYKNMTEERDQLEASYNHLTEERDQLEASYNHLMEERDQLKARYTNLTEERDQLKASHTNLTDERDQLKAIYATLTEERDQLNEMLNLWKSGWRLFGSSWYFLSAQKKTWKDSRQDCLKRGAHLVIINSEAEQRFLHGLSGCFRAYIGLHDINTEGQWEWVDDGPSRQSSTPDIMYWNKGEPNNSGEEDCVELISQGTDPLMSWNDIPCTKTNYWMCEKTVSTL